MRWKSGPLARSNDIPVLNGFVNTIDWDQNQSDLSDLTLGLRRVIGSPWIADFRCWTWPEVKARGRDPRRLTKRITASGNEIGTGPVVFNVYEPIVSYLILHANSPKIINRRINLSGQQLNLTVHCVGEICWNPLRILVIRLRPRLTIASDYWTTSQCGFWSDNID